MTTSLADIERIALDCVARLPVGFRDAAADVVVQVMDWPPREILQDIGIEDPRVLTGLYQGVPLTEKSVMETPMAPDVVWLFREPILAEWRDRGNVALQDLVAHVTVHEFAHHFGWSDAQIAEIDRWWE